MDDTDNISSEIEKNNQSINEESKLNELNNTETYSSFESTNKEYNDDQDVTKNANQNYSSSMHMEDSKVLSDTNSQEFNADGEEVHTVKFVVAIVAAFPAEIDKDNANESNINKPRATEGPKAQNFYKFEYQLSPDEQDTLSSFDLVTYKIAAKLFPEKSDPKVLRSWEHDGKIWVSWNQIHELKLTKTRLIKLFDHEVVLKIWDSRDFCSARTKFDKPKPFKFPKTGENTEESVKMNIFDYCNKYLKQIPRELHDKLERPLPNQTRIIQTHHQQLSDEMTNTLVAIPGNRSVLSIHNKLSELANDTEFTNNIKSMKLNDIRNKNLSKLSMSSSSNFETKMAKQRARGKEKSKKELAAELDFIKKNGATRLKLKMKVLFSGIPYYMSRLEDSTATIHDCFLTIAVENNLMSEQQLYDLNPFSIKIEKITDMPNMPNIFKELNEKCERAYCSYNFFKYPLYKTIELDQDKHLYFNDINVFLIGLLNKEQLKEFFDATTFEIDVHDRDRKPIQEHIVKPCLFGNDAVDGQISSVNSCTSKHTLHNPFEAKSKNWDPYGVAKLNLYEFVLGKRLVEFFVPVLPCNAPDALGRPQDKNTKNEKTIVQLDSSIQAGSFLESNTHLSVRLAVAKPLLERSPGNMIKSQIESMNLDNTECVYGRIIIKVDSTKYNLIKIIIDTVRRINATALDLSNHPINVQDSALSTYKLTEDEQSSHTLNIITGFHLIDKNNNIFVMEGLKNLAIKDILESVPRTRSETGIELLFNTSISFSKRLYISLDVDLLKIKLFEPLDVIVKKPLLYIRDMTPKSSYEALIKLHTILSEYSIKNIFSSDLLPESYMVVSMSKEFGVPLTEQDLEQLKSSVKIKENSEIDMNNKNDIINNYDSIMNGEFSYGQSEHKIPHTSRIWTPIDNINEQFLTQKRDQDVKDFVSENLKYLKELEEKNKHKKPIKNYMLAEGSFHYSGQALNSTELALNKFRDYINENTPNKLYSYNPDYHHSMTFVPVNIKQIEIAQKEEKISKWKTKEGWIFPHIKTNIESNQHPKKPDPARLDEISQPWVEDFHLHTYKMKSTLDRKFFPHSKASEDFDVWTLPKIENNLPISIFESLDQRMKKEKDLALAEKEQWKSKLVVENPTMSTFRLSGATEAKISGSKSSNQLDKLKGILKSEPKKKILLANGVDFNNIPALSVNHGKFDEKNFQTSLSFRAGDSMDIRITDARNMVPIHNYERAKFEKLKGHDFDLSGPACSFLYKEVNDNERTIQNYQNDYSLIKDSHSFILPNVNDLEHVKTLTN